MSRPLFGRRLAPGMRTILAMTCTRCDRLQSGDAFERIPRLAGGPAYVDRRCRTCRWAVMTGSPGR